MTEQERLEESRATVVQYGIERSGSTLIRQILDHLGVSRAPVFKTHEFVKTDKKIVVTYRDFRDALASGYRRKFGSDRRMTRAEFDFEVGRVKKMLSYLQHYEKAYEWPQITYLMYENFFNDFEHIFQNLERFFEIIISSKLRKEICREYSIEANRKRQGKVPWMATMTHICTGKPGTWKQVIPSKWHEELTDVFWEDLERLGYW